MKTYLHKPIKILQVVSRGKIQNVQHNFEKV